MITYVAGNLFLSPAQVLVNPVNTQGVMGKGLALQFKLIYPDMFKEYQALCERGKIDIGVLWIYKTSHKWILNFPTKKYWRNPSKKEFIEVGLKKFAERFQELGIYSIAFPALGCGNGELNWKDTVKPLMGGYLSKIPADIFVYPPVAKNALPEHRDKREIEKWLRSEPSALAFSEVWDDLRKLLFRKKHFATLKTFSNFEAGIIENIGEKFIEDYNNEVLIIESKNGTRRIEYGQLLELWQQFRQHGYLRRGIVSSALEKELSYLIPILSELDYVEKIELSETGDFQNTTAKKTYSGLQYIAPIRSEQPTLFSL
jgi:O-acetyl-ADP-ribose deacetylase (regulator of RNase III)